MKYVIMFTSTPEHDAEVAPELAQDVYARVYRWFQDNDAAITDGGAELQPVETATTLRHAEQGPVVVDGPFTEAREAVGGFSIIDVPDLDAAIALVRTWPMLELPGTSVEIRPMVTDYSQFE
ncbi:YciI family protein [Microbacterium sp. 179-I 3D2 NHS]|uniref:YciI family protein n=1 Tax=Microbacterium sp. 179-I 3D2 NHS TaxID=3235178 RepID=UPI0039A1C642